MNKAASELESVMHEWAQQYHGQVEWDYIYPHLAPGWLYLKVALHISNVIPQAYPNRERIIGIFDTGHDFRIVDKNRNRTGETLALEDPTFFEKLEKCVEAVLRSYG